MTRKIMEVVRKSLLSMRQPVIATILGLLVGAIVIYIANENPISVYKEMFDKSFFRSYYFMQTLSRSTPIIICAIATAAAWRAGYINIGVEGQMVVGGFVATVCAIFIPGPPMVVMLLSILIGMLAGAFYATIAAVLYHKYNVSIVISTLMMNYIAHFITSYFVAYPLRDRAGDGIALQTVAIDPAMRFFKFSERTTFNLGFLLAVFIVIGFYFIAKNTVFGYESKMTGLNPFFAQYGGVRKTSVMLRTMALSGAIAASAGAFEVFGVKYRFIEGMLRTTSFAWTGLMAALISSLNPIGMFFSSIFLAGLQVGGQSIQRTSNVPLEMAIVIQSCITLFVSIKLTMDFVKWRKHKKSLQRQGHEQGGDS